jgi:hypothetical protein
MSGNPSLIEFFPVGDRLEITLLAVQLGEVVKQSL